MTGREKLLADVKRDIEKKGSLRSEKELMEHFEWVTARAEHYAEKTGLTADQVLDAWEENRNYWYLNYYQEANQPKIEGDKVHVFDTVDDFRASVTDQGFRCPSCKGVSKDPQECTSGIVRKDGKTCDWKSYGLFGAMGEGATIFLKDAVRVVEIFNPIAWEGTE